MIGLFLSGFVSVFLLGFQSRLVNTGNYLWAGVCSFTIALAQTFLWSILMKPDSDVYSGVIYGLSGASAIISAMFIHHKLFGKSNSGKEKRN